MTNFSRFLKDESGATAIEYGLIAALIGVALIPTLGDLGDALDGTFGGASGGMTDASGG